MTWSPRPWVAVVALVASLVAPTQAWRADGSTRLISVANGGEWGQWGAPEFCPKGSYAIGFQVKVEEHVGSGDDTSLNAVRLLCQGGEMPSSRQGPWGSWATTRACAFGQRLIAFRLRVEPPQGRNGDDTAANDMDARCEWTGEELPGGGGTWGDWGSWSQRCPSEWGVCGIRTSVEPSLGTAGDNTALNDVLLYCCP